MGRGGKGSCKSNFKRRVRSSKDKGSDDSDEDYVISDAENDESEGNFEDYCSSLDENGSEESIDNFVEEDDEEKKMVRGTKPKRGRKIEGKTSRKRKRVVTFNDDEDEEEDGDEDYKEDDDDDDHEFSPDDDDDDDSLDDEEEELIVKKRKSNTKVGRKRIQSRNRRKRRKSSVGLKVKKPKPSTKKKGLKRRRLRKKQRRDDDDDDDDEDDLDFMESKVVVVRNKNKNSSQRKRRYVVESDSDFVSSPSSDCEYTISEEEREQIKEANRLCGNMRTSLRSSSFSNKSHEVVDDDLGPRRKALRRKGKEKVVVEEVKTEVATQVCGICLSEEDKRRLRGTLDCCSHYFCFTCIMEWSKVESRCPLCKQRFKTISKPARTGVAVGLRDVVIQVPKRDQVYQPTEEELRSYLDPYESVICSECHQGGDDGLMLLCDLCDSSAHTYCVGLGREVPEGNWYCDGCKPVALGSSSSHVPNPLPDQRTEMNNRSSSPIANFGDGLEDSFVTSPRTTIPRGIRNHLSPRFPSRDVQATNPVVSGAGASTLSGRRMIHRHIQNLLSMNRMSSMVGRTDEVISTTDTFNQFLNSPINQIQNLAFQPALLHNMTPDYPSSSMLSEDDYSSRLGHLRREPVQGSSTGTTNDRPVDLTLWPELARIGRNEQVQNNRSLVTGSDGGGSMEQVQSMVKNHLKNLSRDIDLGEKTFKEIATSSTDTILAACGLEHSRSEVHVVAPPLTCSHVVNNNNMGMIGETSSSVMNGCCSDCFDSFVKDVVKRIMDTRLPQWLSLGL